MIFPVPHRGVRDNLKTGVGVQPNGPEAAGPGVEIDGVVQLAERSHDVRQQSPSDSAALVFFSRFEPMDSGKPPVGLPQETGGYRQVCPFLANKQETAEKTSFFGPYTFSKYSLM